MTVCSIFLVAAGLAASGQVSVTALNRGEIACSCDVTFDALPSNASALDLLGLTADAEGRLELKIPAAKTSFEGDFVCHSRARVRKGVAHHVAFSYSLLRQRVALYLDGRLQFENDNVYLPKPAFGEPTASGDFAGTVRNLRVYDIALSSDRLLYAVPGDPSKTVWDVRRERNEALLRARLAHEFSAHPNAAKASAVVAFTTDPMSSEMVLPQAIPEEADFAQEVNVFAAQDEFESASVVVMARRPVGSFTLKLSDLRCGDAVIPAHDVDIRLVKRWYRTGGAWFSYFADFRHRVLTPHLLVYDDELIKVDELRMRNYYRLDYPEGTRYSDVSDPARGRDPWNNHVPFNDAKTLQPIRSLDEFGRNQQYWLNFHAKKDAKPGVYRGKLDLVADGRTVGRLDVNFRIYPFALPVRGASYDSLDRPYIANVNVQGNLNEGLEWKDIEASARAQLQSMRDHNALETASIMGEPTTARLARECGFPADIVFADLPVERWQSMFRKKKDELTEADRTLGMRVAERYCRRFADFYRRECPDAKKYCIFYSEDAMYTSLGVFQADQAAIAHKLGWEVFAHGLNDANFHFAGDLQEMQIQSSLDRQEADRWHALGASVCTYAKPFAAPENPAVHRRFLGLLRQKFSHYDGNMQHGMKDRNANQFAPDPFGDGNYRCQIMLYPTQKGFLETICWEGVREAFDDVRYVTKLQQVAKPLLDSADEPLRREARRALAWLEKQGGATATMETVRLGCADRILTLLALQRKGAGK